MEVSSATAAATSSTAAATTAENERGVMNKDDFLKLFLASLQYQDPMSPMETKDMMEQMSQLTMVEQITNLGKVVDSLKEAVTSNPLDQGVNYLGKEVSGITSSGEAVEGQVSEVKVNQGVLELLVNNQALNIGNISRVANYSTYTEEDNN
ncbi:flagellar hook capping FlgD N-terminal domain-containing protein [Priestia filamentosa]|uniref:flagellar hook capping FlgD N-terminal domain-containing protein n=1 Tax=Priestia filamentosa TaxID=1402861 RepID=UPI000691B99B